MDSDEHTPLLSSSAPSHRAAQSPSIRAASRRVGALDASQLRFGDIANGVGFKDHPTQVSFALAALLHLRKEKQKEARPSDDLYGLWLARKASIRDVDTLEKLLLEIWTLFLAEYRSVRDIQSVLCTSFVDAEDGQGRGVGDTRRVVDFLAERGSPGSLLAHPLVSAVIQRVWTCGTKSPRMPGLLMRYDALSTPRVIHFIDWSAHAIFLVLLFHYLLYPIEQPHTSAAWSWRQYGPREASLVLLALSFGIHSRSFVNISSLLVPISFLTSLPSAPHPESFSFIFLQWAAFLQPLGLNSPQPPSHLFFFEHSRSLPLALLISRGLSRILYPVLFFFLPLLLLAAYLLSLSLADAFLRNSVRDMMLPPLETRYTFLSFFVVVLVLLLASISVLAISVSPVHDTLDPWDRYSEDVGRSARRVAANAVSSYSTCYIFPPPFNLIRVVVVWIPKRFALISGCHSLTLEVLERVAWRVFVGPLAAFVAFVMWTPGWLSRTTSL